MSRGQPAGSRRRTPLWPRPASAPRMRRYSTSAVIVACGAIDSAWRSTAPAAERECRARPARAPARGDSTRASVSRQRHELQRAPPPQRPRGRRPRARLAGAARRLRRIRRVRSSRRAGQPPAARTPSRTRRRTPARPTPGRASSPYALAFESASPRAAAPLDVASWQSPSVAPEAALDERRERTRTPRRANAGRSRRSRRSAWRARAATASRAIRSRRTGTGAPACAASGSARRRPWLSSDARCGRRTWRTARIRRRRRSRPARAAGATRRALDAAVTAPPHARRRRPPRATVRAARACETARSRAVSQAFAILAWHSSDTTGEATTTALTPCAAISDSSSCERPSTGSPLRSLPRPGRVVVHEPDRPQPGAGILEQLAGRRDAVLARRRTAAPGMP